MFLCLEILHPSKASELKQGRSPGESERANFGCDFSFEKKKEIFEIFFFKSKKYSMRLLPKRLATVSTEALCFAQCIHIRLRWKSSSGLVFEMKKVSNENYVQLVGVKLQKTRYAELYQHTFTRTNKLSHRQTKWHFAIQRLTCNIFKSPGSENYNNISWGGGGSSFSTNGPTLGRGTNCVGSRALASF